MAFAYREKAGIVFSQSAAASPVLSPTFQSVSDDVALWGDNNLYPQKIYKAAMANSIIPSTLDFKTRALYSSGIQYGIVEQGADGETRTPMSFKEVDDFLKASRINRYLMQAASDFYWFGNFFPQILLNNGMKPIFLTAQQAVFCRYGAQDMETGELTKVYVDANWENPGTADAYRTEIPLIDPYDPKGGISKERGYKYIYPCEYPSPGAVYYNIPPWHSVFESGWVGVSSSIPKIKEALLKKGLAAKYHIEIPDYWWQWKFPDWESLAPEERKEHETEVFDAVEKFLLGMENAGKTFITGYATSPEGKEYKGWTINLIEEAKDGQNIEDSQEASAHIMFALGVPSTILSYNVKGGFGGGSGSDVREHFNAYLSLCQAHEDAILEPLHFIRDLAGWPQELRFWFKRPVLRTQNEITPSKRGIDPNE